VADDATTQAPPLGLRERKKQRTRELIAETARQLFAERGFERVPVAEIARAAEVSEQTVFNYFPRKEDLVYWRLESFEDELLAAIREREAGESFVRAFGRFILRRRGLLAERDQEARLIADELGSRADDVLPWVVANSLMGVHRALIDYSRGRIVAGASSERIARELRARGERAIDVLEEGLGSIGVC
jgi:AcrR family transcriptional regulator